MGCSVIEGRRVYGRFYAYGSFGPTNLPRALYLKHKEVLEEIEITPEWLKNKTGKDFPIGIKPTEFFQVDFDIVIDIAHQLGIEYIKSRSPTTLEQSALRRAIIKKIDAL